MENLPKAFSNVSRVKIISCLAEGCKNVSCLVKTCGLSQSAVSQHLKKLRDLGIVRSEATGRDRLYRLTSKKAGEISAEILKLIKK